MSIATAPWREPVEAAYPSPALFGLAGVDQLRAMLKTGQAPEPPIRYLTGMRLTDVGLGTAAFSMPASEWLSSPQGPITVGTLAILADGPLGCAVQSALPPATAYATSELSLRLMRPALPGGELIAQASLVHATRSLGLSRVQIIDDRGRLLADGSSLCFVRPPSPSGDGGQPELPPAPQPNLPLLYERAVQGEVVPQDVWDRMSGLDVLRAQISGDIPQPPIGHLTGARPVDVGEGTAVFRMPCHEWLCSPLRTVEGGTIAMLADFAIAAAIQTTAPPGAALAPVDLKINFLRPAMPDGRELVARGRVRHAGRSIAIAEAEVTNADDKAVALATGSALILPDRPAALAQAD